MECAFQVGFFIVRGCGRNSVTICSKCNTPLCDAHRCIDSSTRSPVSPTLCLRCLPRGGDDDSDRSSRSDSSSSSSSSSSTSTDSFSGGGGKFGGAGASSQWSSSPALPAAAAAAAVATPAMLGSLPTNQPASDVPISTVEAAGFSEADAALFDEVSKFDESTGDRATYDS